MSENIIIQEAGISKSLTVDALRLKKQDGGTEDWVPVDGKNLVELQIGGSGTYRASDYNAYGIAVARVKPKYGGGATSKAAEHGFTEKHTPSIKEGGKSRNFSATMLKTNLQGGGTCLWAPEDEVNLDTKYVDHSGTYRASADNCYGYSQITVSGVDVEIKKDDDGDDVAEITDGGETREEKLPSEIRIEREPNFTGPYGDGAYISFEGLLVKAYTASGKLWTDATHPGGIIPISELIFPVTVTDVSQATQGVGIKTLDGKSVSVARSMTILQNWYDGDQWIKNRSVANSCSAGVLIIKVGDNYRAVSDNYDASIHYAYSQDGEYKYHEEQRGKVGFNGAVTNVGISDVTHEMMYYGDVEGNGFSGDGEWRRLESPALPASGYDWRTTADIALHGEGDIQSGQTVPVQWNRPYDGRLLEASFMVEVVDVSPNTDIGGNT